MFCFSYENSGIFSTTLTEVYLIKSGNAHTEVGKISSQSFQNTTCNSKENIYTVSKMQTNCRFS